LLGIVAIGEKAGWWRVAITWEPYFLTLMWIATIPCGFIVLITWRIARRFGRRGLVVAAFVAAVLGPVRDYRYMATFPQWSGYAPGLAPVFAISAAYVILGISGHGTMRLAAGPAPADRLARRPWEPAWCSVVLKWDPGPHFADCAGMEQVRCLLPRHTRTFSEVPHNRRLRMLVDKLRDRCAVVAHRWVVPRINE
jgi:hypothetical protein